MQFRHKLISCQQNVINNFIHFKVIILNIIKTKQLLNTTEWSSNLLVLWFLMNLDFSLIQIAQFDTSINLFCLVPVTRAFYVVYSGKCSGFLISFFRPFNEYLHMGDKSPMQRGFFTKSTGVLLPALGFLGRLYNFCNFVIIFSLMYVTMICRSSDIFYIFGNDRILPKNVLLK